MLAKETRQLAKGLGFLSPWIVGFLLFMLIPIAMSFYFSLCDYNVNNSPMYIGADNYIELLHDSVFWQALGNTLYYAAMALPAGLLVSLGLALLLNVKVPGQALFRTIIFLPSIVPIVASAMLWLWLYNAQSGLFNSLILKVSPLVSAITFGRINLYGPAWLSNPDWAMPSLVIMSVWGVGNTVVIYLAGLQDVPVQLYEAAELDGAGTLRRLWHVTLPFLSPVIFFNLIMSIIGVLQILDVPYIMTQGGPVRSTYFISMYLRDSAFTNLRMGYASAMAWIMLLLVLALTGIAFWTSRRWVHYEGK